MLSNAIIAVIGSTGKSGKFVVKELIRQGIQFRMLVRDASVHRLSGGEVVQGDVRFQAAVMQLTAGCSAIISTLGQPKGQPAIFSMATRRVMAAMEKRNIKRYIVTTGLNVDTPSDRKGPATQAGTQWMRENYAETTADKQDEYELLATSAVDWTLVRLPYIGLTEDSAPIVTSLEDCPGTGIHGTDLARFLVQQIVEDDFVRKAPFLANRLG